MTSIVYADDIDIDTYIDILNIQGVNGSYSSYFSIAGAASSSSVWLSLPMNGYYNYIEFLVKGNRMYEVSVTDLDGNSHSLSVISCGNNSYKYYGNISGNYINKITINFESHVSNFKTDMAYCRIWKDTSGEASTLGVTGSVTGGGYSMGTFSWINYENFSNLNFNPGTDQARNRCRALLAPYADDDWKKSDYWIVHIFAINVQISSVSSDYDNIIYNVDYSDTNQSAFGTYDITVKVDLRTIKKDSNDRPYIYVDFTCNNGQNVGFGVTRSYRYTTAEVSNTPWLINLFTDNIKKLNDSIGSVGESVTSIYTRLSTTNSRLTTINDSITSLNTTIGNGFSDLGQKIVTFQTSVNTYLLSIRNTLASFWSDVNTKLDTIINLFNDNGAGEEFRSEVEDLSGSISAGADVIDSFQRPDIDSINTDLTSIVSKNQVNTVGNILVIPMKNSSIIMGVVIMSLTFSIMGFAIFGKR